MEKAKTRINIVEIKYVTEAQLRWYSRKLEDTKSFTD